MNIKKLQDKKIIFRLISTILCINAILLLFFPVLKIINDAETVEKITGFELVLGKVFPEDFIEISEIGKNVGLLVGVICIFIVGVLNIFDLKKYEIFKIISCLLLSLFSFVNFRGLETYYIEKYNLESESLSFLPIGYLICFILLIIFVEQLFDFVTNKVEIDEEKRIIKPLDNKRFFKILFNVICYIVICLGLFVSIAQISSSKGYLDINYIRLATNYKLKDASIGFNKLEIYYPSIIFLVSLLGSIVLSVVNLFNKKPVFIWIDTILYAICLSFIINIESNLSYIKTGSVYNSSLTIYGQFVVVFTIFLFVYKVYEFYKEHGVKNTIKLALIILNVLLLTNLYSTSFHVYSQYEDEDIYNESFYSFIALLKTDTVLENDLTKKPIYAFILIEVVSLIVACIKFDKEQIQRVILFILCAGALTFFIYFHHNSFKCLEGSEYNFVKLYQNGVVHLLSLITCTLTYSYLAYKDNK